MPAVLLEERQEVMQNPEQLLSVPRVKKGKSCRYVRSLAATGIDRIAASYHMYISMVTDLLDPSRLSPSLLAVLFLHLVFSPAGSVLASLPLRPGNVVAACSSACCFCLEAPRAKGLAVGLKGC